MGICKGPFGGMVRFDKSAPTCGGRRRTVGLGGAAVYPTGFLTCPLPELLLETWLAGEEEGMNFCCPKCLDACT